MIGVEEQYWTPPEIARKMLARVDKEATNFLEPSAGRGDIADVIINRKDDEEYSYGRRNNRKVDCIELDPDLISVLLGKGLPVVGYDWLTYPGVSFYDAIIMNPPFAAGDRHLLRTWDFLHEGEIVCLLNQETILNPHTAERARLAAIIADHGDVEFLGECFKTAARKTNVKVALVYLKKVSDDDEIEMWANLSEEKPVDDSIGASGDENMLAIRDNLGNMEHWYNQANGHMLKAFAHLRQASLYMKANGIDNDRGAWKEITGLALRNVNSARAEWSRKHRHDAWIKVFDKMQFHKWLDKKQREGFVRDIELNANIPFTKENIQGTLENVLSQRHKLFEMSVANVFDELTRYFKGNTSHHGGGSPGQTGWFANEAHKVNKKLVFPYGCSRSFGSFSLYSGGCIDIYNDLDRVLCVLDGRAFEDTVTIGVAMDREFRANRSRPGKCRSAFFDIQYFIKGTVHLKWLRPDLMDKFNVTAAQGRKWLGMSNTKEAA
jgi:Domain of unknown function (DUF4942)